MQKLYMIFRKCQGSAFDVIDTRQKKIATILSVSLLEGYFRSTYHRFKKKKILFSFFFFFCCKRFQFDASFHHHYLFSQKKGGKFQEFIFLSLQVFLCHFFACTFYQILSFKKIRPGWRQRRPSRRGAVVTEAYDSHHANWIRALRKKIAFNVPST